MRDRHPVHIPHMRPPPYGNGVSLHVLGSRDHLAVSLADVVLLCPAAELFGVNAVPENQPLSSSADEWRLLRLTYQAATLDGTGCQWSH